MQHNRLRRWMRFAPRDSRQFADETERMVTLIVGPHLGQSAGDGGLGRDWVAPRDEANALVAFAFRSGPLEDLHAGRHSALLADDELSRITDAEMKVLMVNASRVLAGMLRLRDQNRAAYDRYVREYGMMYCRSWEREGDLR